MAKDTAHTTQHKDSTHSTQRGHSGEQEPSGKGHRNTAYPACKSVNTSRVAKDTAHATEQTERAHR